MNPPNPTPKAFVIELPVEYTVATCRKLNPFHWVLLRAVQAFPTGSRPSLAELTRRLQILEPAFLEQAWTELVAWRTTDADDFAPARLSLIGEEAMRSGWLVIGERTTQKRTLYFQREDGLPVKPDRLTRFVGGNDLAARPAWCGRGMATRIAAALSLQVPEARLQPGERVVALVADWLSAREGRA